MSASRAADSIAGKVAAVEREVQTAVLGELPRLKENDSSGYAKVIHAKGAVSIRFAGIDAGMPMAASFSLGLSISQTGSMEASVVRESCPGHCLSGVRAFWMVEGEAIERLRASGGLPSMGMPELARNFVQIEIDAGAPGVLGPVDVLRIGPAGPVWLQRKARTSGHACRRYEVAEGPFRPKPMNPPFHAQSPHTLSEIPNRS